MRNALYMVVFGACLVSAAPTKVTYHKDVEPILQKSCQGCHRPGEAAPMSFLTYQDTRPWAKAMRAAVLTKKMPPWFADPKYGHFSNDRTLSQPVIDTLVAWVDAGAPEGDPKDAPKPLDFVEGWAIGKPDLIIEMPKAFSVPASGKIAYQYIITPSGLTEDRWVQAAEIRPGDRSVLHHVQAHAIPATSNSAKSGKIGEFLDADAIDQATIKRTEVALAGGKVPDMFHSGGSGEFLAGYTPGSVPMVLQPGRAKLIKAGSLILFQLHYTASGKATTDRSRLGIIFAKEPPAEHVKTVNVQNFAFTIPPGVDNYPIVARARLTRDITIVNLRPHMHGRGKDFEYRAIYPTGESEIIMRVPRWDFAWQMTYYLDKPKMLPKGTIIEVLGHFDNSANNPNNPDPAALVVYGEQTWNEMLGGLIDVSLDPREAPPELFETVPVKKEISQASTSSK